METIFDHHPTKEELWYFTDHTPEQYAAEVTSDEALTDLARLFALRNDSARADAYCHQIADENIRFDLFYCDLRVPSAPENAARCF